MLHCLAPNASIACSRPASDRPSPRTRLLAQVGLRAAKGAGMHCIITPTTSTASADFCGEGAAAVVQALKGPNYKVR